MQHVPYEKQEQIREIEKIILHPEFKRNNLDYDLALIKLQRPVHLTDYVRPICLPDADDSRIELAGHGWATGWGKGSQIEETVVPVHSTYTCFSFFSGRKTLYSMFCAGKSIGFPK